MSELSLADLRAINEGAQAEEYKARKAAEKEEAKIKDDEQHDHRYGKSGIGRDFNHYVGDQHKDFDKDIERANKSMKMMTDYASTKPNKDVDDPGVIMDGANRHLRRHGSQNESFNDIDNLNLMLEDDWV